MTELGASAIAKVEVEFDREAGSVRLATSSSHCIRPQEQEYSAVDGCCLSSVSRPHGRVR